MKKITGFIICLLLPFLALPQDDHPWAQQFGAISTIMGGAVVGGVRDNSAIFYNPGALSLIDNNSISVDANVYKVDKIMIHDGAGDGVNLNSTQVCIYPQIISGTLDFLKIKNVRFAYALLTRNYNNVLMNQRYTGGDFAVNPLPDLKDFVGVFDYNNQLTEQWFCLGSGYRVNEKFGIGLTLIGYYRAQTYQLANNIREIIQADTTNWLSTLNADEEIKYKSFGMLFKIGAAYQTKNWRLGITLTTPSFQVWGKGDVSREFSMYAASENPQDTGFNFLIMDKKSSVHSRYRHPWSVAGGVEYRFKKTRLCFSAEWYLPVKEYKLMSPGSTPFIYPPEVTDSAYIQSIVSDFLYVSNSSHSVVNFAIGLEQELGGRFNFLFGANTDFSAYKSDDYSDVLLHSAGGWDLYHLSTGLSYKTEKQTITVGFRYSFSLSEKIDPYTVITPNDSGLSQAKVWAQSFALIIGYTHYLHK